MKQTQENWIKRHPVWTGVLGCIAVILLLLIFIPGGSENGDSVVSTRVSIGEEGRLYQEGYTTVIVCKTKDFLYELTDAAVANDEIGWRNIIYLQHKCYVVSTLDDSGRVLVLDRDGGITKFRFINSDVVYYKKVAWTFMEYIIPIQ